MITPKFNEEVLSRFRRFYSDSALMHKLGAFAEIAGLKVVYVALLLFYVMKSRDTMIRDKALILGALGYLILPIDLIPDSIPVLGFTDDFAALAFVIKKVEQYITPSVELNAKCKLSEWFKTIDDATLAQVFKR